MIRLRSAFRANAYIAPLGLAVLVSACGGGSSSTQTAQVGSDVIQVDGSSTVFPITEAVAEEFQRENKNARVTVGVSGTGGGFQKFCRGETDMSNASRPISQGESDACHTHGITYVELPIAYDGITIVVHPKNTWATSMTVSELKKLWEPAAEGKITRWNQIRPSWPDREIHLFGAGVDSGTFDYFTEALVGRTDASRGDYTSSEDDNMLVQGVSGDENALGFFGYAYYEENKTRLKAVAVDDEKSGKGAVLPSPETIREGTYRPLSRPVFVYVSLKSIDRPTVKTFAEFYLKNVASLTREVGYVPLSDADYQIVNTRYQARKAGSMFGTHSSSGVNLSTILSQAQ